MAVYINLTKLSTDLFIEKEKPNSITVINGTFEIGIYNKIHSQYLLFSYESNKTVMYLQDFIIGTIILHESKKKTQQM
jgi:hypothetical protein